MWARKQDLKTDVCFNFYLTTSFFFLIVADLNSQFSLFAFGCAGSSLRRGLLSSCGGGGAVLCWLWSTGCSLQWLLLSQNTGSRAWARQLWYPGFASRPVSSSWIREGTHSSCTSRWALNPWATGGVHPFHLLMSDLGRLFSPLESLLWSSIKWFYETCFMVLWRAKKRMPMNDPAPTTLPP